MTSQRMRAEIYFILVEFMTAIELTAAPTSTNLSFVHEGGVKGGALAQFVGGPPFRSVDTDSVR